MLILTWIFAAQIEQHTRTTCQSIAVIDFQNDEHISLSNTAGFFPPVAAAVPAGAWATVCSLHLPALAFSAAACCANALLTTAEPSNEAIRQTKKKD